MSPVIALLRAVNVGGRTVKAAQLRAVAEGLGHTAVTTYVNSGNLVLVPRGRGVVRGSGPVGRAVRRARFRRPRAHAHARRSGTRSSPGVPFTDEVSSDPSHLVLYCWDGTPKDTVVRPDAVRPRDGRVRRARDVRVLPRRHRPLEAHAPRAGEGDRARPGTARNWNTVLALQRLARERA